MALVYQYLQLTATWQFELPHIRGIIFHAPEVFKSTGCDGCVITTNFHNVVLLLNTGKCTIQRQCLQITEQIHGGSRCALELSSTMVKILSGTLVTHTAPFRALICSQFRMFIFCYLVNKANLVHNFSWYVYFFSLHVSGNYVSIIRRNNCIYTTLRICHSV